MLEVKLAKRQLMEGGKWLVPKAERPALREPPADPDPNKPYSLATGGRLQLRRRGNLGLWPKQEAGK